MAGFRVLFTVEMVTNCETPEQAASFAALNVAGDDPPLTLRDARLLVEPVNQDPFGEPDSWAYDEEAFERLVATADETVGI